jgi:phenylacetic acid degradation protein
MLLHKIEGTGLYQALPADFHANLRECEPLRQVPDNRHDDFPKFETWQKRRSRK